MEISKIIFTQNDRISFTTFNENLNKKEILTHYCLSENELTQVTSFRRSYNKLGYLLQLKVLKHKGWTINKATKIPEIIIIYICKQLNIDPNVYPKYWLREKTVYNHLFEIKKIYGFRTFTEKDSDLLRNDLQKYALDNNTPYYLISILENKLKENKIIFPKITTMEKIIQAVITLDEKSTYCEILKFISEKQKEKLNNLLLIKENTTITNFAWLQEYNGRSTPENIIKTIKKIDLIKEFNFKIDFTKLSSSKINKLIRLGKRYQAFSLKRFETDKRYSIMIIFLIDLEKTLYDRAIIMHDVIISSSISKSKKQNEKDLKKHQLLTKEIILKFSSYGSLILQAKKENINIDKVIEKSIKWVEFEKNVNIAKTLLNKTNKDIFSHMNNRFSYLRKYTPLLLNTINFKSNNKSSEGILEAIKIVKEMNNSNKKTLPEDINLDFTSKKWSKIINKTEDKYRKRHYYELAVYSEIKNTTRSGDLYIPGSKDFNKFESYLISENEWEIEKKKLKLSAPLSADEYLANKISELKSLLKWYDDNKEIYESVIGEDSKLHIKRYKNETPETAKKISQQLFAMIPKISLTNLILEVARLTGFHKHFFHASNQTSICNEEDLKILITSIIAIGTNIDFAQMANSFPGISYKQLARTAEWRIFDENLEKAHAEIVNNQINQKISDHWGDGSTSSSDGMHVKTTTSSTNANKNLHYGFDNILKIYRFVNDKYAVFYSTITNPNCREGIHVIDGLLKHETQLKIKEHYTDTAGYTHQIFSLMDLMGFHFAPRIRNIPDLKLYCPCDIIIDSKLRKVITGTINVKLIKENYNQILRLTQSIYSKKVSSALILSKLGSYSRNNSLSNALKEMGKLEKTIFILKYASQPELQKRIQRGLNKGEAMNGLAREVFFGRKGQFWENEFQEQLQKSSCLNIILNCIVFWNTIYLEKAVNTMKEKGMEIDEKLIKHVSPLNKKHINFLGKYSFEDDGEFEKDNLRKLNI